MPVRASAFFIPGFPRLPISTDPKTSHKPPLYRPASNIQLSFAAIRRPSDLLIIAVAHVYVHGWLMMLTDKEQRARERERQQQLCASLAGQVSAEEQRRRGEEAEKLAFASAQARQLAALEAVERARTVEQRAAMARLKAEISVSITDEKGLCLLLRGQWSGPSIIYPLFVPGIGAMAQSQASFDLSEASTPASCRLYVHWSKYTYYPADRLDHSWKFGK